ncbi:vitamin K epoxide reductase family protein [Pseudactinotalea terrae]|uniref:vitamin K epoxide reductase family protein n=1 Tax=Pseudactinotalea terrae TaxID=1743262 RepID=UPI0019D68712|nr:vitamin K epoxide reductase family protein [Pseudactinotalea terrae]
MTSETNLPMLPGWRHSRWWVFGTMTLSGVVGLIAAFVLSIDALELAAQPDRTLVCDINAVLSCGAVARSWQASLLGFPNAYLGLVAEPVVITIGLAGLGGTTFPRWFLLAGQGVYTLGLALAYWLFVQSLTQVGAVCPWCLLVTVSTTAVWVSLTHHNLLENAFALPSRAHQVGLSWLRQGADVAALVMVVAVIIGAVLAVHGSAVFAG